MQNLIIGKNKQLFIEDLKECINLKTFYNNNININKNESMTQHNYIFHIIFIFLLDI